MNMTRWAAALLVIASLALPACAGRQQQPQKSPEQSEQKGNGKDQKKAKKEDPVKEGAKKMRSELDDLRVAVQAGDGAAARKSTQDLDATWEKIEGKVRAKDPEQYDKIERPLHAIISGAGVTPFDRGTIGDQIDVLDEQLAQLNKSGNAGGGGGGEKKKVDMRIGAAAMRYNLAVITETLEKDTAAAQKAAKDADEAWEKFQGDVKNQNKDAYQKIEEGMHNLMAAAQATPLDKKKVKEQVPKLDSQLAELLK
ncbi:MAG TPA: hypothetical protein VNT75_02630 [Symbiobacteriaceae bacterium]|nr:hypothetical protein [Symbiobacteriaceae bacterium]